MAAQIIGITILAIIVLVILVNFKKIVPLLSGLKVFFEEVAFEMGKVSWPTRDEVVNSTILVGVTTIALTLMVLVVDSIFLWMLRRVF
jgi:preprotein translocase SecE subunit